MANSSKTIRKASSRSPLNAFSFTLHLNLKKFILFTVVLLIFSNFTLKSELGISQAYDSVRGISSGFFTPQPTWSLGLQLGSYASSGISLQWGGIYGGAIDLTIGTLNDLNFTADYIRIFMSGFRPLLLGSSDSYRRLRGNLVLYLGGGGYFHRGLSLRLPIGISYCMVNYPIQFFGGINLMVGPILAEKIGVDFGVQFGIRLLI